jgi:hypothetical protein
VKDDKGARGPEVDAIRRERIEKRSENNEKLGLKGIWVRISSATTESKEGREREREREKDNPLDVILDQWRLKDVSSDVILVCVSIFCVRVD